MNKSKILDVIEKGRIDDAIKSISKIVKGHPSHNTFILISSQWSNVNKDSLEGIIDQKNIENTKNRIIKALIEFVNSNKDIFKIANYGSEVWYSDVNTNLNQIILDLNNLINLLSSREANNNYIKEYKDKVKSLNIKWESKRFRVAVMALIKSGKSTLLNAWIGEELLPSKLKAETMKIVKIVHNSNITEGVLYKDELSIKGAKEIRNYIESANQNERQQGSSDDDELYLEVNIPSLSRKQQGAIGFEIIDTPGVNEYDVSHLELKTNSIIDSADAVIYLLDITKLHTVDESIILNKLKNRKNSLLRNKDKLFFVLNKIDEAKRHELENDPELKGLFSHAKQQIESILKIQIKIESIIGTSAEAGLLCKLIKNGKYNEPQLLDFKKRYFGDYGYKKTTLEECLSMVDDVIAETGIEELEEKVLSSIYQKRASLFFYVIIEDIENIIDQLVRELSVDIKSKQANVEKLINLKKELDEIKSNLEVFGNLSKFQKKTKELVEGYHKKFENEIKSKIKGAFKKDSDSNSKKKGFLAKVIDAIWGVYEIEDINQNIVQERLSKINLEIVNFLEYQYSIFWENLIEEVHKNYWDLSKQINKEIEPTIRKVENTIGNALNIRLKPSKFNNLELKPEDFHNKLQSQMLNFVNKKTKIVTITGIRKVTFLGFEIPIPIIEFNKKSYFVISSHYLDYVNESITPIIKQASNSTLSIINKEYISTVNKAKTELDTYISKYTTILSNNIANNLIDIDKLPEIINNIECEIEEAENIRQKVTNIRENFFND